MKGYKIIRIRLLSKVSKKEEEELFKRIRISLHHLQKHEEYNEVTILWPGIDLKVERG